MSRATARPGARRRGHALKTKNELRLKLGGILDRGGALHGARAAGGDGRTHAPVVCDGRGATGLVRLGGWAVAPFAAGMLMQGVALATPLLIGAGMKIGYDLLLWRSFRDIRPPEERVS